MVTNNAIFTKPILLIWLLCAAIFLFDLSGLSSSNNTLLYLLPVLLGLFLKEQNDIILLGIIATVLSIVPVFLKTLELPIQTILFDRIVSVGGIWAAVYLVLLIFSLKDEEQARVEQFRALFEYASIGIVIVNSRGQIIRTNPFAEMLFDFSEQELIGENIEIIIPERFRKSHKRHRNDYKREPKARIMGTGMNLAARRKDGAEFPVEVSLSPFRTNSGDFVMAFVLDTTVRKENENRILRQNNRLEQLAAALQNLNEGLEEKVRDRTQALEKAKNELAESLEKERELGELKSRFVSMASHEFRTPLSTVLSSAALIRSYVERRDQEKILKHTNKIKSTVNNLNTILTEFLSLGKLEEGKTQTNFTEINLPELIAEVVDELKEVFKTDQTVTRRHEGPEHALLDPGLLKHVLINLVSNASKYSPQGADVSIHSRVTQDGIRIDVTDQGMGIPESEKKHLFSRFFRASNASNIQGTGLGLYIVKRYVELLNGSIDFESEEGKGSTFSITLKATDK